MDTVELIVAECWDNGRNSNIWMLIHMIGLIAAESEYMAAIITPGCGYNGVKKQQSVDTFGLIIAQCNAMSHWYKELLPIIRTKNKTISVYSIKIKAIAFSFF